MKKERLHKRIASTGYCSRRQAEGLIAEGRVSVNGRRITKMGVKVKASDRIEIDGKPLPEATKKITVMLHKPAGCVTSKSDPHNPETVMDYLPENLQHLNPIGRLDKATEGLLLLSSDGALVEKLTHPKFDHTKVYHAEVEGQVQEETLEKLSSGELALDDRKLKVMPTTILSSSDSQNSSSTPSTQIELTLTEGRKRQIRRVMEALGHPVIYLKRVAIGQLTLGDLAKGEMKVLNEEDLKKALLPSQTLNSI